MKEDADEKAGEIIDCATGRPDPAPRRIDLSNLRDVRLELARLYRRIDAGELDSRDGSRRAFVLRVIHDVLVNSELERRLDRLEQDHAIRVGPGRVLAYRRANDVP